MIHINYITGFPNFFDSPLQSSMLEKAYKKSLFSYRVVDLRDYTLDKHKSIDDKPYGGFPGMVLRPEPLFRAIEHIQVLHSDQELIYCSPDGEMFNQEIAESLAKKSCLTFICGHFKGIDQRVIETFKPRLISIGNFVITGGELASLVITDACVRLIDGVLNNPESAKSDSFIDGKIDHAYYTRPRNYRDLNVPETLVSGHHKKINEWKTEQQSVKTRLFKKGK